MSEQRLRAGPDGRPGPGPMTCRELVELVTAYLEDALPADERTRLESHLRDCEPCVIYLRQIEATIRVAGAARQSVEHSPPVHALLQAFREWKRGANGLRTDVSGPT